MMVYKHLQDFQEYRQTGYVVVFIPTCGGVTPESQFGSRHTAISRRKRSRKAAAKEVSVAVVKKKIGDRVIATEGVLDLALERFHRWYTDNCNDPQIDRLLRVTDDSSRTPRIVKKAGEEDFGVVSSLPSSTLGGTQARQIIRMAFRMDFEYSEPDLAIESFDEWRDSGCDGYEPYGGCRGDEEEKSNADWRTWDFGAASAATHPINVPPDREEMMCIHTTDRDKLAHQSHRLLSLLLLSLSICLASNDDPLRSGLLMMNPSLRVPRAPSTFRPAVPKRSGMLTSFIRELIVGRGCFLGVEC